MASEKENLEGRVLDSLSRMRDELNIFIDNCENATPGDYQRNIEATGTELYKERLEQLCRAFVEFKDLCLDDWVKYE